MKLTTHYPGSALSYFFRAWLNMYRRFWPCFAFFSWKTPPSQNDTMVHGFLAPTRKKSFFFAKKLSCKKPSFPYWSIPRGQLWFFGAKNVLFVIFLSTFPFFVVHDRLFFVTPRPQMECRRDHVGLNGSDLGSCPATKKLRCAGNKFAFQARGNKHHVVATSI